jgi:hypothetical protein
MKEEEIEKLRLCYIDQDETPSALAFFTSDFEGQWGDDWNDSPYESNAGAPYPAPGRTLCEVEFRVELMTPADASDFHHSGVSVETINTGRVAWLAPTPAQYKGGARCIYAGCTLAEFRRLIDLADGRILAFHVREELL